MTNNSMETILPYNNRDLQSEWSMVWSTTQMPGMDNATGSGRRLLGRRRLRMSSLALGSFLVMHCQAPALALSGGMIVFVIFLVLSVFLLANPMRHFEIYLGQWSMSGPGRAFRFIPMLDGIGIAICINALVRAITCSAIAAIIGMYLYHTVNDAPLPYTFCRNFNLQPYGPNLLGLRTENVSLDHRRTLRTFKGTSALSNHRRKFRKPGMSRRSSSVILKRCKEEFPEGYPMLYTPNYNFFYIELMDFKSEFTFRRYNIKMVYCLVIIWSVIWILMIAEQINYGRIIWNNLWPQFVYLPWIWLFLLGAASITQLSSSLLGSYEAFKISSIDVVSVICDAFEVALYIHSSSCGTEIILGKGLNYYGEGLNSSGHIDPNLNSENVWHSLILTAFAGMHIFTAGACSLVDMDSSGKQKHVNDFKLGKLWVLPLYSRCTLVGNHTHLVASLLFSGLMLSYIIVAFVFLKSALHTIFEYRVKLVFIDKFVVALVAVSCFGLSLFFTFDGGLLLLEQVDSIMTGVSMPFICLLELFCLLYMYRSRDFLSDMNIATEDNALPCRIGIQWQVIPFICLVIVTLKVFALTKTTPIMSTMYMSVLPLVAVVITVPIRAMRNALVFLSPTQT